MTTALGRRIRTLRKQRGLDQTELARILGIVPSSVSDWERGHTSPRMGRLAKLAEALRVPVSKIVGGR